MVANKTNIRLMLIAEDDVTTLSDALVDMWISKAENAQPSTDDDAVEYYTCYLISLGWQSLGFVTKQENTTFAQPNPEKFKNLYEDRIENLQTGENISIPATKVILNKDFQINESYNVFERNTTNRSLQ